MIRPYPKKCTFGVASGKFLAYLVTQRGIEANPDQISAILSMKSPTCVQEVQIAEWTPRSFEQISQPVHEQLQFFQAINNRANFC